MSFSSRKSISLTIHTTQKAIIVRINVQTLRNVHIHVLYWFYIIPTTKNNTAGLKKNMGADAGPNEWDNFRGDFVSSERTLIRTFLICLKCTSNRVCEKNS